ncbi:hypothetical protein J0H58_32435, partial [bacterium]|nr:hypothetical protein [bacterium]
MSLLSRRAEDLGRSNPDVSAAELANRLSGDSAAGPMLQAVAAVRGESVDKVVKEFAESIRGAQRQLRVQREVQAGRLAADQSAAALSRLTDAVTNAAGSVGRFETSMTVLGSVFSGQGGTGRVTSISGGFASFGTGTGVEFRRSAAAVGAALGPSGSSLLKSAEAGDQLARVLPSVLATLGSSPLGPEESYGKKTRDLLYAQLLPNMDEAGRARALEANPELARAIESAVGSVVRVQSESEGDGGLAKRLQQDAGRVANEVTEAFAGPLREAGERMARAIEDQSNKYVDGLASARQMLVTAGESLDRVGELRLAGARVGADVAADRTGRAATDVLSLQEMQAPFVERQRRLTGLGVDAENPAAIAARLRRVTGQVAGATAERDAAVGNRDRFAAALANASERAAGLQEKLTAATANRDSRLGYAEKYLFAGDEQRARMQRGQSLVIGLDRGRVGFNALSMDEQRLAVETLGDFGQTRLASGRTAEGLRRQLLGSMPGVTDVVQEGERRGLQDQVVGVFNTAEQAQRALADNQRDLHGRFITDLRSLHEQFFARLATNLAAEQVGAARNGLASAQVTRGQLRREEQQRGVLARVGVTGQAGLQGLRASEGDLRSFLDATDRLNALRGRALGAGDTRAAIDTNLDTLASQLAGNLFSAPRGDRLREVLATRGLGDLSTGGQQAAIDHVTTQMSDRYGTVDGLLAWELKSRNEQVNYIENLVRRGLEVGREHTAGEITRERDRAGDALRARGVNTDALAALNTGDRSSLTEAVRTSATDLATLDARIRETEVSMTRFREQLDRAGAALNATSSAEGGGAVLRRADGGFTPRGTDTVPAMLTPGEFVVNRASTQANMGLLREINAARGPVQYRQTGGPIIRAAEQNAPSTSQVAQGYLWATDKINKAMSWLGFSQGGVAYLAGGGLAEQYDRARLAASLAENSRGAERGALVGGGTAVIPALDAGQASYRAYLRRREAALARRLNPGAGPVSKVVAMTPAEALAANRALNTANMGFSQALARSGMDDGQVQAALGSLAQRRDFQNRVFLDRYGAATADVRMRDTQGWAAGAGVRRQNAAAQRRAEETAMRWMGFGPRPTARYSLADRFVSPLGDRANSSFNVGRFADGGFVGGSGTGDTIP